MINDTPNDIIGAMEPKMCRDCGVNPRASAGSYCKECRYARTLKWRKDNPEKYAAQVARENAKLTPEVRRKRWLKKKYGMAPKEYDDLLTSQSGVCKTCGYVPKSDEVLHVDHNHATGAVRGLLCPPCNQALGLVRDRIEVLESLITYLKEDG